MATLTFVKNLSNEWVAEFKLEASASIHIEFAKRAALQMMQRTTASGEFAPVVDNKYPASTTYDFEIMDIEVYPKFIRIVSAEEPTYAEVISNGEVTELKFQEKVVEITSNGTTAIAPDAGFAAMTNVQLKVNVPTSGEGGGGSSKVRYLNVEALIDMNLNQASALLARFPGLLAVKAKSKDLTAIAPFAAFGSESYEGITSAAILDNFRGFIEDTNDINSSDLIPQMLQFGCVEITEEEFYNLNA